MMRLLQRIREWMMYPRKADREAARRTERFLRAFVAGDTEYQRAEMVRVYGAEFFALVQRQQELQRIILRDRLIHEDEGE